ncbi:MAG TPA: DUF6174 domain-containing protein [Conexibacter sp.]|nr:DUF6174 domain-containing protein [Conexibacter sp.]
MTRERRFRPAVVVGLLTAFVAAAVVAAFAVVPATAITPVSPGPPDPQIRDGTAQRELDAARDRWAALGVRSYRLRVRVSCFCPDTIRRARTIVVRRGKPVGPVPSHLRRYATVPRLFTRVQDAIDADVARLTATYGAHGVPKTIYVDQSEMIADEEQGVTVDRFKAGG